MPRCRDCDRSYCYRLSEHFVPDAFAQVRLANDIDGATDQVAQVAQQTGLVEVVAAGLEIDEDVDVAVRAIVATSDRSEDAQ